MRTLKTAGLVIGGLTLIGALTVATEVVGAAETLIRRYGLVGTVLICMGARS
jgi:hypothetical protein